MDSVYGRVVAIVVRTMGAEAEDVQEETSFVDDLSADSLDVVELIQGFEEEFSTPENPIEIPDDVAPNITTVREAVAWLKEHGVRDEQESHVIPT